MQKIPSASLCLITNTFLTITGERRASVQLDGNDIVEILKTNIINASKIPIFISLTKRLTTSCEYGIFTRNKGEKWCYLEPINIVHHTTYLLIHYVRQLVSLKKQHTLYKKLANVSWEIVSPRNFFRCRIRICEGGRSSWIRSKMVKYCFERRLTEAVLRYTKFISAGKDFSITFKSRFSIENVKQICKVKKKYSPVSFYVPKNVCEREVFSVWQLP